MTAFLDYASSKYYEGNPIISDEEFDRLAEAANYEKVGASISGDRIPHFFRMWSLQKVYEGEGDPPSYNTKTVDTVKLDGAAISILYGYGRLMLALTRGDGVEGLDITDNIRCLVPDILVDCMDDPFIQITGEVVAPKQIENARNYAAGALNLKSVEEFKTRSLKFIAYGVFPNQYPDWSFDMDALALQGFSVVTDCDWEDYPNDGRVVRIDNYKEFNALGYTAKHPRGAYAIKTRKRGPITRLLDIEWQVGRSGVVSPVAILEPVKVGDAMVSRATLHNYKYIQELDLDYGCLVEVVRSGEIIPRVVERVYE